MDYFELTHDEIMSRLTDKPRTLFEPILDELVYYHNHTEEIPVEWSSLEIRDEDGIKVNGYPLNPYVAWRLTNYVAGVGKNSLVFWEKHPNAWVEVLRAAFEKLGTQGSLVITNGEIVAVNYLEAKLYSHLIYFEQMFDTIANSIRTSDSLATITGFQVSPVWTFVRILPIRISHKYQIGFQAEANYLFKRGFRRASFSFYMRDIRRDLDMSLAEWWSIGGIVFNGNATDFAKSFERRFKRGKAEGIRNKMDSVQSLLKRVDTYAESHWKQATFLKFQNQGASEKLLRTLAADFGYDNKVDYCMTLLPAIKKFSLDRQLLTERQIAKHLKGTK